MSDQHTPGPWEVAHSQSWNLMSGESDDGAYFIRRPDDDVSIADEIVDPDTGKPSKANADLMAAAPDLLAACQKLIDYRNRNKRNWQTEKADDYFNMIQAAITRATGEQEPA